MALVTQQESTAWGGDQLSASWCTPAPHLGHVTLLNGWSVSEFGKLVQLDSGVLGNSIFCSPKNRHLHTGFSSSVTEGSASPQSPAPHSYETTEDWGKGEE